MLAAAGGVQCVSCTFLVFLCHVLACCSRPAHTTGGRAQHPCPWRGRSNLCFLPPFFCFPAKNILVLPFESAYIDNCYPPWQFWRPWLGQMYHIFSVRAEHTQAAAALRSRLLAPSISTPAAASSPGDTRPWNAFSKYDHFKHEIFIRSQAAASI